MPQHDDHDELSALDFYGDSESEDSGGTASDALDFSAAPDDTEPVDALDEYVPVEPEADDGTELEAIDAVTETADDEDEDEESGATLFSVANPTDSVLVSALMDGRTHRVQLSPKAVQMSEADLAEEIVALAEVARQKGLAGQHSYVMENAANTPELQQLSEFGMDPNEFLHQFMETGMQLPTPAQATEVQTQVFASRYGTNGE